MCIRVYTEVYCKVGSMEDSSFEIYTPAPFQGTRCRPLRNFGGYRRWAGYYSNPGVHTMTPIASNHGLAKDMLGIHFLKVSSFSALFPKHCKISISASDDRLLNQWLAGNRILIRSIRRLIIPEPIPRRNRLPGANCTTPLFTPVQDSPRKFVFRFTSFFLFLLLLSISIALIVGSQTY